MPSTQEYEALLTPAGRDGLLSMMLRAGPLHEGRNSTVWSGLSLMQFSSPASQTVPAAPSLCVAVQGEKHFYVGGEAVVCGPRHYIIDSSTPPLQLDILAASPAAPFLGLMLELDMGLLGQLLIDLDEHKSAGGSATKDTGHGRISCSSQDASLGGIQRTQETPRLNHATQRGSFRACVSAVDAELEGALCRLLEALRDPLDCQALATGINREILYRLIRGEQGDRLLDVALQDGANRRMSRIVRYLSEHFNEPIGIEQLAHDWGLSTSALHHSFHKATGMSPLQFLKKTRLCKARALMVERGLDAGLAGYEVGYTSNSQFSREFKRMFGMCPSEIRRQPQASSDAL